MSKKTKIIIVCIVAVLVVASAVVSIVLLTKEPEKPAPDNSFVSPISATPPTVDTVYFVTEKQSFWIGIGSSYLSFEYRVEPEIPEEGKLYGYVFEVYVSSNAGKNYDSWLTGTWTLNDTATELTLTATWSDGENITSLADATSGEPKIYTLNDGVFSIGMNLPSAGSIIFTLNVTEDLVSQE